MAKRQGVTGKLYVEISAVYTAADLVQDVDLGMKVDEVDATTRAGGGVKEFEAGLLEIAPSFPIAYDPTDAVWEALRAAFFGKTTINAKILDGTTDATGKGPIGTFIVSDFSEKQPLNGIMVNNVKLAVQSGSTVSWQTGS